MNVFGRKKTVESDFSKLRQRHLDDFMRLFPHVQFQQPNLYTIPIQTPYGKLILNVSFTPQFPLDPPLLSVQVRCIHKWIDDHMILSKHPNLQKATWTSNSNTSFIIKEIVDELTKNPPQPLQAKSSSNLYPAMQTQPHLLSSSPMQPPVSDPQLISPSPLVLTQSPLQPSPPELKLPSEINLSPPSSFPLLETLTLGELQSLDSSGDITNELIEFATSSERNKIEEFRSSLYEELQNLANEIVEMDEEASKLHGDIKTLRNEMSELQTSNSQLMARQQLACKRHSLKAVIACLDKSIQEADDESEKIKEQWESFGLSNKIFNSADESSPNQNIIDQHNTFADQYAISREIVHKLSAKRERLIEVYGKPT